MKTLIFLTVTQVFTINAIAQWQHMTNGMGTNKYIYSTAAIGNNLFAGLSTGEVYSSTNYGGIWYQCLQNTTPIHSLLVNGSDLYAGASQYGVFYTSNSGINWSQTSLNKTVYSLAVKNNSVFAGTDSNGVYKTTNNGINWVSAGLSGKTIYALTQAGGLIVAGLSNNGMYVSTDEGSSWIPAPVFNLAVFEFVVDNNVLFAGTSEGIYKSTNFGFNWSQIALEEEIVGSISLLGTNLFAGTFSGGVYVSNNYGANWTQRNEGLTQLTSLSLCIIDNYIFNGTQNSIFRRPVNDLIGIEQISSELPLVFSLGQNYPNPFNPSTSINFSIAKKSFVKLSVYDMLGRELGVLVNEYLNTGVYKTDWNASEFPSGVYFYKLQAERYSETKKMILVK